MLQHPKNDRECPAVMWFGQDQTIHDTIAALLTAESIAVRFRCSEAAALEAIAEFTPMAVVVEWKADGVDSRCLPRSLRRVFPHLDWVPFILLSDQAVSRHATRTLMSGFAWILESPIALHTLPKVIREASARQRKLRAQAAPHFSPARVLHFGCTLSQADMNCIV